ncbi:UNVERIFIED_CONTAM: Wall-associated receptor kinase-like 2 [Sesamum radiatum]|uniref:Wall-associated receptor kinase-like 2 n=1 Tax=Sesamum radiatum TaxID=300843 RepID=A0AAW2K1W4_SESRA
MFNLRDTDANASKATEVTLMIPKDAKILMSVPTPKINNCPENAHCVNTEGSYFCLPDHRRMLALLIPLVAVKKANIIDDGAQVGQFINEAVISDFGLSRSVSIDKTHLTTLVGGTFGYLDPGYFRSGKLNDKSDVYAFGVVLAEILTGEQAVSSKDDQGLALRFRSAVKDDCWFEILDKVVVYEGGRRKFMQLPS